MLGLAALCGAIHSTFCKLAALLPPSTLAITKLLKQGRVTADHRMRLRLFLFELLVLNVQNRFFFLLRMEIDPDKMMAYYDQWQR